MNHDRWIPFISSLAGRQDRCVTRVELLAAGIDPDVILRLRRRGVLTDVFPGIYLHGPPAMTHREFLRASVLHAGPEAYVTHGSGLELRELVRVRRGKATVTTKRPNVDSPAQTLNRLEDGGHGLLTVRRSTKDLPLPVEVVGGFETSLLPRTLVDAAGADGRRVLRPAWREAEFRCLLDPDVIVAELQAHRRPGNRLVRERLQEAYPLTRPGMDIRSKGGELRFLSIVAETHLPTPQTNVPMTIAGERYVADFFFPDVGLVVETDGGQHEFEEQMEDDKVRDVEFFNVGLAVIRFTNKRMKTHRAWVRDSTVAAYERRRQAAA